MNSDTLRLLTLKGATVSVALSSVPVAIPLNETCPRCKGEGRIFPIQDEPYPCERCAELGIVLTPAGATLLEFIRQYVLR